MSWTLPSSPLREGLLPAHFIDGYIKAKTHVPATVLYCFLGVLDESSDLLPKKQTVHHGKFETSTEMERITHRPPGALTQLLATRPVSPVPLPIPGEPQVLLRQIPDILSFTL